jgi:catalase (peroxidase I)
MYEKVANDIIAQYEALPDTVGDNQNPRGKYAACLVRLVGHDFMDFRKDSDYKGGTDGCLDFSDQDNLGLEHCIQNFNLQDVYSKHCQTVSLADFFVIAAEASMGRAATGFDATATWKEDTLLSKFRNAFRYGRETQETCPWAKGRMPNPTDGCPGLKNVFEDHVFADHEKPWTMTAAISGAHTLGGVNQTTSGFNGFWSDSANQGKFNNNYYRSIITKGWIPELAVGGVEGKNQWARSDSGMDLEHKEMMLDTDMCLFYTTNRELSYCKKFTR